MEWERRGSEGRLVHRAAVVLFRVCLVPFVDLFVVFCVGLHPTQKALFLSFSPPRNIFSI